MADKIKKIISIVLLASGMFFIFMFSAMDGEMSTKASKSIIELSPEDINQDAYNEMEINQKLEKENNLTIRINKRLRKFAHFIEFCILAIIITFAVNSFGIKGYKCYLLAIMSVFIYACMDEFHQFFISGRDARMLDVFIDVLGGTLGCTIYAAFSELFVEIEERLIKKI